MNHPRNRCAVLRRLTAARFALLLAPASLVCAQSATASSTPDAATIARFDRNKDGRLDPEELRLMETEMKRGVTADAATVPRADETVTMSPFEVVSDTRGYYAANTMSGTRLNTRLEDLASSITVITKEQMEDFAMLDINDIFLYAANTEGTGTFMDYEVEDGQGSVTDATSGDPANANRIRGIGNANVSIGNFESSNRVPIDPIDADGIEISRGPNANIFGLGNASGTLNVVGAKANLRRNRATLGFRADSFDGYRQSIDVNRVLIPDILAFRANAVRQRDGYHLKPSGVDSQRYNAMVQFRPFKTTTINASYQSYRAHGNRPNSMPPLDGVSDWLNAGAPTWDPVTNSRKLNGVVVSTSTSQPAYLYSASANFIQYFVDQDGSIPVMMPTYGVSPGNSPADAVQNNRRMLLTRALTFAQQPLISRRVDMIDDKSFYDYTKINLLAPNRISDKTETARITVDQIVFDTQRQKLAAQFGFFREDSERYTRYLMAAGATNGPTGQMVVDVNERLLDGRPNPFFLRPLIQQSDPRPHRNPIATKTYRAQAAYQVDFTRGETGFKRWLGSHGLVGYGEYKEKIDRRYRFYESVISDNPWLLASDGVTHVLTGRARPNLRLYLGDDQGYNIDYAPGTYSYGAYTLVWGNATTPGTMRSEPVVIGEIPASNASGSRTVQKTEGAVLQSRFLQGRIIGTFGKRSDRHYTKFQNPTRTTDRGFSYDYEYMNQWRDADWQYRKGSTEQRGVVTRPFQLPIVNRHAESGSSLARLVANTLRNMSVHYNESDSFKPANPAMNVYGEWLPDPSGFGKDYGFSLNMFDGRLVLRVNKYRNEEINKRNGPSGSFARTLWSMDHTSSDFGLQRVATQWITEAAAAQGRTLTAEQLNSELATVMGISPRDVPDTGTIATSETDDVISTGHEIELHYNPTRYWTIQASFTEKQVINARLAQNVSKYITERMPHWTSIVDPRTGTLWWDTLYGGSETPFVAFRRLVANPLATATATEGLSRPQIRRYGARVSTNFRLSGITDQKILKNFNVGGALRYDSKGSIGYYGLQQLPEIITGYDINRPIWDKERFYADAFVGYRTRLWSNRIGTSIQLNVRNLQESGRLQAVSAGPDGTPNSFRIVAPRQFILSTSFDL